ncbi:MAG: UDP-N-acetylmuramoyl-L-alanyl-D-glutamate--2,6-diaminopimelate ligase [Pseudomonadota bacterium]
MALHSDRLATLSRLLEGLASAPELPITDLVRDSRRVTPGSVFLALSGQSQHAITYAAQAVAQGAVAVVTDLAESDSRVRAVRDVPVISIPEREGLDGVIGSRFFGAPTASMDVVAVTGTNGKSSVSWLIGQAMAVLGRRPALMGTLGWGALGSLSASQLTTPDALTLQRQAAQLCDEGCDVLALEASSHALDQARLSGTNLDVAVFTNLTRDHLDYHGSMTEYFEAKARLFDLPGLKHRVVAVDDEWGVKLGQRYPDAWLVGAPENAVRARSVQVIDVQYATDGVELQVETPLGTATLRSALIGPFNVQNLALTLAALLSMGVPLERAVDAVGAAPAPPGRLERVSELAPTVIVDYAHTPAALTAAIDALLPHTQGKLWCVFGCGGDRDRGKRPAMAAAASVADRLVLTSDNPRSESPAAIIEEILTGVGDVAHDIVEDRAEAIAFAVREAREHDTVLVAGKGHEQFQVIGSRVRDFDDRVVARLCLDQRAGSPQ